MNEPTISTLSTSSPICLIAAGGPSLGRGFPLLKAQPLVDVIAINNHAWQRGGYPLSAIRYIFFIDTEPYENYGNALRSGQISEPLPTVICSSIMHRFGLTEKDPAQIQHIPRVLFRRTVNVPEGLNKPNLLFADCSTTQAALCLANKLNYDRVYLDGVDGDRGRYLIMKGRTMQVASFLKVPVVDLSLPNFEEDFLFWELRETGRISDLTLRRLKEHRKYVDIYSNPRYQAYGNDIQDQDALQWLLRQNPASVCDVGAGRGAFVKALRKARCPVVHAVDLLEPRSSLIEGVVWHKASAHHLPLKDREVEYVTCWDVLEHLLPEEVPAVLRELRRVSSKGVLAKPCYRQSVEYDTSGGKTTLHPTVQFEEWWARRFQEVFPSIEKVTADSWFLRSV